jgi:hydrogenase maturation protease
LTISTGNKYVITMPLRKRKNMAGSGDGAALMEVWRGEETVIIIDAVKSGALPGTIRRFDARAQPIPKDAFRCSTHAFGVAEAIELARALARLPPESDSLRNRRKKLRRQRWTIARS